MPRKKNPVNPAPANPPAPELVAASTLANEASGLLNRLQTALGDLVGSVAHPFKDAPDDGDGERRRNPHEAKVENGDEDSKDRPRLRVADEERAPEDQWVEDVCPICRAGLVVAVNVVRVRCPSCDTLLDMEDEDADENGDHDEEDADEGDERGRKRRKNPGLIGAFMRKRG